MPTIIPITDLRKTNEISELCNSSPEPVFVTKNGHGDLVIMSMAVYEEQLTPRVRKYKPRNPEDHYESIKRFIGILSDEEAGEMLEAIDQSDQVILNAR
jgi:PHD/YefM family antitoxin component YafN of YafNO toxin-antitoxin module